MKDHRNFHVSDTWSDQSYDTFEVDAIGDYRAINDN